ncbi:glycosyltransferase family 1 protein [Actinoalloteichus sp. AHMU CJ021]|uniref:glycosyltransferase n=1 Tax=Actinoalloteichus TaxID=65496 RepID=UPI0004AA6BDD|nr:glycosyltransferase [Actinoalloteichus caeruleus]AUS80483.1 glycosyltransferase family 1 protein [Actinoalloteichus sp. AHMU CJ021]
MRISMVSEHASPLAVPGEEDCGGQNVHVAELSSALVRQGHEVRVYTRRDSPDQPCRVTTDHGVEVVHLPAGPPEPLPRDDLLPHMGEFADHLLAELTLTRPDVVHAHFWTSGLASLLACRGLGIPVAQTFHALGHVKRRHQGSRDTSPPQRLRLERMIARDSALVVASCSDEVHELGALGIRRTKVAIVPCGVDTTGFHPDGRVADRSELHRVVTVGRLIPRKGFDLLIAALRAVPNTELLIAGGPDEDQLAHDEEANRLRSCAVRGGVADRVHLLGRVPREDMPALLRSADIVACTPWYEPFGIVPLEAMACGVPVVASAVGGLLDTIVDGVTGQLVPPKNPRALATALRGLLNQPARRHALGLAGFDRAFSRYSWDRVAYDTVLAYQRLAPPPPPASLITPAVEGAT